MRTISQGSPVLWDRDDRKVYHYGCIGSEDTSRTITVNQHRFTLKFERKNFYLETLVRQIAGAFYDTTSSEWFIENPTPVSAKQLLDLAEDYNFEFDNKVLNTLADTIKSGTQIMLESMARTSSFEVKGLKKIPFPFQVKGIEFGINNQRVIIADQMGLGKTIQAMGIIAHLGLFPAIIVCPSIIKLNWQRELLDWIEAITEGDVWTLQSRSSVLLPPAKAYIVNYEILPNWLEELKRVNPKIVVFDEFHYLKTPGTFSKKKGKITGSQRSWAARELVKDVPYILGLTGTPILNRPEELIHPLRILGRLNEMGGKDYVEKRYCNGHLDNLKRWNTSGASNLEELNERLRSSGILIRRLKTEVLPDLPEKLPPTIICLQLTNRSEYLKAERDLAKWLAEKAIEDAEFKASIKQLAPIDQAKRISSRRRSVEYLARKNQQRTRFIYLKRLSTIGKLKGIQEHINTLLLNGEKLLVFGWFRDTQVDVTTLWPAAVHVLGQDSDKVRAESIHRFKTDPNCKLMIASLKVLGIGENLTAASHVAFVELGWNPGDHDQAEDRLHRIGQTVPVNPYYYYGEDTIERDIIEIIDNKRKVIATAIDGVAADDESITNLLITKLLAKYKYNGTIK